MIRLVGTIILLPVALVGLLIGALRFAGALLVALAEDGVARIANAR